MMMVFVLTHPFFNGSNPMIHQSENQEASGPHRRKHSKTMRKQGRLGRLVARHRRAVRFCTQQQETTREATLN